MLTIGLDGTQEIAEKLAALLIVGDCVTFKGDLGAGKTTMVESMIRYLHGGDIAIISPTFNLLQTYEVDVLDEKATIWHYDLYRLEEPEELHELGLEDAFENGITFIEWPEIAFGWLPDHHISVTLEFTEDNDNRNIKITSSGANLERLQRAELC